MNFEFDPDKSAINKDKHGLDFVEAQALWSDGKLLIMNAKTESERRFIATGKIGDRYWTAAWTWRDEKVRIISVRRARKIEVLFYEGK